MKFPQRRKLPFESMIFNSVSKYNLRRSSSHLILSLQFLYDALAVVVCFFSTGKPSQRAPTVYCFHVLIMMLMLKGTGTRGPGTCITAGKIFALYKSYAPRPHNKANLCCTTIQVAEWHTLPRGDRRFFPGVPE